MSAVSREGLIAGRNMLENNINLLKIRGKEKLTALEAIKCAAKTWQWWQLRDTFHRLKTKVRFGPADRYIVLLHIRRLHCVNVCALKSMGSMYVILHEV